MHIENLVTFIIYFIMVFIIALYARRKTRNLSGFILSNRELSGPIAALGVGASDMSGWLLLALPGAFFLNGLNQIWLPIGLFLGSYINWRFVAARLRVSTEKANNSQTIPEYFGHHFRDNKNIISVITAVVIILFFTFYASAGFVSGAVLFKATFGLSYMHSLWIIAILIMGYTAIGGFVAVNRIDFFQGCLMFLALLAIPIFCFFHIGSAEIATVSKQIVDKVGIGYFRPFSSISIISVISLLAWGLGYFGQPHILSRFMAIKTPQDVPMARRICTGWMFLSLLGAMATGLIGAIYYHHHLDQPESVFLHLSQELFNPWVAGILLSAVLSAVMSTVSAQLLSASSSLASDIYKRYICKNASDKHLVIVARTSVLCITLIAVLLAINPSNTILQLVGFAWGGLGAVFGPIILLSLFWKGTNKQGVLVGMILSTITVITWKALLNPLGGFFELYEIVPGFIVNIVVTVLVSLWAAEKQAAKRSHLSSLDEKVIDEPK